MPKYTMNGKTYNIPDSLTQKFESQNPDATVAYSVGEKRYNIPVSERDAFLKAFPDAATEPQPTATGAQGTRTGAQAPAVEAAGTVVQGRQRTVRDIVDNIDPMVTMPEAEKEKQKSFMEASALSKLPAHEFERVMKERAGEAFDTEVKKQTGGKSQVAGSARQKYVEDYVKSAKEQMDALRPSLAEHDKEVDAYFEEMKRKNPIITAENAYTQLLPGETQSEYVQRMELTDLGLKRQRVANAQADVDRELEDISREEQAMAERYKERLANGGFLEWMKLAARGFKEPLNRMNPLLRLGDTYELYNPFGLATAGKDAQEDILKARRKQAEQTKGFLTNVGRDMGKDYSITGGLARAAQGVKDVAFDPDTWSFGHGDLQLQMSIGEAAAKVARGEALDHNEQRLLDGWAMKTAYEGQWGDELSGWTKAGLVTGESLPFMVEMVANPASGLGKGASKMVLKEAVKRMGTKWVRDHMKSVLAGRIAGRVLGDVAGATLMSTTTGAARVAADFERRMTGDVVVGQDEQGNIIFNGVKDAESPGAAFAKALASTSIENWSEMAGEYLGFVNSFFGKALGKSVIGKAGRRMLAETGSVEGVSLNKAQKFIFELTSGKGVGAFNQALGKFAEKTQWHGMVDEYLEEVMGNIANAALVGDMTFDSNKDTGVFNLEQNIDTFCGVALMGGFMSAMNTVGYAGHRWSYNVDRVNSKNAQLFGGELWEDVKAMLDNSLNDPRELNDALTYLLRGESGRNFSADEKKAILKYTQAALEKEGGEMASYRPRVASVTRRRSDEHLGDERLGDMYSGDERGGWEVSSWDKNGGVIETRTFATEDEAKAYEGELKMRQQKQDYDDYLSMTGKLSFQEASEAVDEFLGLNGVNDGSIDIDEAMAAINDPKSELGKQFRAFKQERIIEKARRSRDAIARFEQEHGWSAGTVRWLSEQDPMELDAEGLQMADEARSFLEGLAYPQGEVHVEHEVRVGADAAQGVVELVASSEDGIDPMDNAGKQIRDEYIASVQGREQLFAHNEELKEEVERMEQMGLSAQEIVSSLDSFSPQDRQVMIDYYNAKARHDSFMEEAAKQIDNVARRNRERRTFTGTINGSEDRQHVVAITDGANTYTLVSGHVRTDGGGVITDSDSGLIIGVDANGDFVQIGDGDGYSVVPGGMTLDDWEALERERLQEQVSLVVDPNGAQAAQEAAMQPQGTEQARAGQDNAGGEAGADGTGGNEPPAPAPILSDETNDYGKRFVISGDGSTTFGEITAESGLTPAPLKLSEGEDTVDAQGVHHGYGLAHIEAERGDQIRKAGYVSVQEFVETVARNWTDIREGNVIAGNQTYLIELTDEHNNTLFVQLSKDGSYWNINSAGIFRKKYSRNKPEVYSRPALGSSTSADAAGVNHGQSEGATVTSGDSPSTSAGKDSDNSSDGQGINVKVDKDGVKRYENGVGVDDAIADIQADGLDVGEVADASIAEAQAVVEKINGKQTKTRKDLLDRKRAQDVIGYYQALKERWAAMVSQESGQGESEENINNDGEEAVSEGNIVPSQAGSEAGANTPGTATMAVQGAGRRQLNAEEQKQERIKALKAELGELFDDDFTKADDVYELVSMWVGRKRNLAWDDVNGKRGLQKELGWTRKIGGDTKYIETLLAKKGEGMGVDEFVHMVWESEENTVNGEKRFDTDEIKNALLDLLKSAQSKSDVVDYAVNTRERAARAALEAQQQMQQEAEESGEIQVENLTAEQIADIEANLPFAAPVEGEDIPDSPITQLMKLVQELMQQEGMPQIKLVDTDRMSDDEWYDITSAMYGGAFVSQEEIDFVRNSVLSEGLYIIEDSGAITVYSDSQTPEEVKYKIEYIKEQNNGRSNEEEAGELEAEDVQRPAEGMPAVQGSETAAAAGAAGTEGQGSTEPVVTETPAEVPQGTEQDEYLQPRNEKERQIIADVEAQLQQEIGAAIKERDKAASDLRRAQERESERATDMFSDDEAFQEDGQLFSFDEMGGTDRTQEGVNRRTEAERKAFEEAKKKVDQLQSEAERNSRIRGALDKERRQTSFIPEGETSGTVAVQPQSREDYLASHPLTEAQIMADEEATEDEKLNAIDFLRGEDDSAISRFYYEGIYERNGKGKKKEKVSSSTTVTPTGIKESRAVTPETSSSGGKDTKNSSNGQGKSEKNRWQYVFHYNEATGRAWITRDNVSGPVPLQDGRFYIEGNSLAELRGVLENPANGLGEVLKEVEAELHNAEVGEQIRNASTPTEAIEQAASSFREEQEQKSQDQQDIDDALKEFNDFLDNAKGSNVLDKFMRKGLEGNDKAQSSLLDAFTLTNEAQRMFLKDLLRLASKVGYAYIKSGIHDAQAWSRKMADGIGRKLKEVLGWEDDIIGEFVDEVWQQKYTVDGVRMRLSEHAERLKNGNSAKYAKGDVVTFWDSTHTRKLRGTIIDVHETESFGAEYDVSSKLSTDNGPGRGVTTRDHVYTILEGQIVSRDAKVAANSVNVNKQENNEAEKDVSLQGDSAEFAERHEKINMLSGAIRILLSHRVAEDSAPLTMTDIKREAKNAGVENISDTDLQELVEAEVVNIAREFANTERWTDMQKFRNIVDLYDKQPSLNARDNDRINKQQYSTPAPMAFLMGLFVNPSEKRGAQGLRGLEPSAGNGMLTIGLPKEGMHVNDIDEMRLSNLQKQGFGEVTSQDGLQPFEHRAYDFVVTNPPFGSVSAKTYDGVYEISGLEHQMAINALESMKDDGRAAIVIGGNTEYNQNGTIKGKDRAFLNYLYSHYNVVDVINMDGKTLYSRQGTGFPVRMILINGRKEFNPRSFAPVIQKARAERVNSYDELYKRVNDDILSDSNESAGVHDTESGESNGKHDNGHAGTSSETGVRTVRGEGGSGQRELLDSGRQPVSGGVGSTQGGTDIGTGTSVGKRGDVVHGTGSTATQPSGSAPSRTGSQRDLFDGGNDSERPDGRVDTSFGAGQRGTGTTQQTEQPAVKRGLGTEKVPYRKQSGNPFTLQSLMPAEQADVVKKALEELGDVDQFLVDELGYSSKEELHQALAAEQIDSVAMAIHQMNQGNAFIIGDQTGIGKGRQAAALIRYGVKKGGFPVFITVKKGLFSDMYRDLCDIGSPELRPFIWSADDTEHSADVTDKDGNVVYKRPSDKEQKRVVDYINKYGKLPPEYDYIITTYDSFKGGTMVYEEGQKKARNFGKKQPTTGAYNSQAKRDALEVLSQNSFVIMDESHNAGGEGSAVSGYLQYITAKAKGVTFLSATFAKRPGNMPIYSLKTAISKAGVKVGELIDAVKRGGATFQEIMSKALTEAGQMIRRERDMTGVTIDWKGIEDEDVIEKQRQQYDTIIGLFNDIIDFQRRYVDPIVNKKNDEAADEQGEVDHTPGTRDMGINNTPFASRTYNMVQQVLLSLKAEETAKRAIEHLKAGRKPVIALANTNEGAADEVSTSEDMEMPDLSVNLKKGLQGTLRITKKDAFGNSTNEMIPFDELSEAGQARYREIMDAIENASSGLSLSPIDVIKNELKKAGYKVGELTGRKQEFVYNEDGTVKRVKRQDSDKKRTAADFNNGKLDVLILNKSAGTGISLHASSKFDDQRQRVMIVAQAQGDVNDEVQIRGRIDRTGQVLRGMYEYVVSQIPSEQRLLMMLKAKLRSLDANTTSSQKSKFNEMQVQDIINKYGDDIVIQYLAEHPDLAVKMVDPLKWNNKLGEGWDSAPSETLIANAEKDGEAGKTASKVLGRMALLKVAEQEKMLQEIGELYQAEIDRLNEMGENDLEITEMPLRAKTLKKDVWEEGVEPGGNNPFADNSYVEEVEMDVLRKPMKAEEVKKSQTRLLGGKAPSTAAWEEYKRGVMGRLDAWESEKKKEVTDTITARAEKKAQAEKEKYVKAAKKAQEKNGMTDAEIEKNGQYQYDNFYQEEMNKLQVALDGVDKQKQAFVDALETFTTDGVYALPTDIYDLGALSFEPSFGKVIDIKIADNFSTAASSITFATLDGRRKVTIPISGMVKQSNGEKRDIKPVIVSQTAQVRSGVFGSNASNTLKVLEQNVDNWDKLTSTATRKKGYIITGNLLKALTSLQKQHAGGKLISFTTDTGEIRQGVLMGDNFDPGKLTSQNPISSAKSDLDDFDKDRKITSADGEVTIKVDGFGSWKSYTLKVPKSKKKGEKYFNDEELLSLMSGQFEGSSAMKAEFPENHLDAVLKRLDELGVTVQSKKEDANNSQNSLSRNAEINDSDGKAVPLERRTLKSYTDKDGNHHRGIEEEISELEDRIARAGEGGSEFLREGEGSPGNVLTVNGLRREAARLRAETARRSRKKEALREKYNIDEKGNIGLDDLSRMFHDLNSSKVLGKLFDKVVAVLKNLGVDFRFTDTLQANVGGRATAFVNVTFYNWDAQLRDLDNQEKARILLHEMIHNVSSHILFRYKNPSLGKLTAAQEKLAKEIIDIYNFVKDKDPKRANGKDFYGLEDEHEMVSELANPEFRDMLSKIPYKEGRSVWQRIKDWFKELFGLPTGNTVLDSLSHALDHILEGYDERENKTYRGQKAGWEREMRKEGYKGDYVDFWEDMQEGSGMPSIVEDHNSGYSEDLEDETYETDTTFSNQLDAYKDGEMKSSDTFSLGSPSPILRASGIKAKKLILTQSVLAKHLKKHGLSIDDIRDLPSALAQPMMVYEWGDKAKSHVIITDLTTNDGRKITVTLRVNSDNVVTEVSKLTSVHGKDATRLISEMNTDKTDFGKDNLKYVDKEKALNWLAMDSPTESRQDNQELVSAAKIIKEFENPSISDEFNTNSEEMNQGYSERESKVQPKPTRQKENIRKHVEKLLNKLGTRNRTTVITSINGVRNKARREHIENMHKQGKKVYGWFENGHIYLYLPDIDSIYKAEQTIWHETVAHLGLRELLGTENYGKLLNRLWMQHKDKEMGEWVTRRMQVNGWSLHKAIDEWLAREAEKVVAERQERRTLWQKLAGWVGDILREIGYRTNPTITDIRYLFWLSENQLREGEPMSAIKRAAFLHRLERENSTAVLQRSTGRDTDMDAGYSEDIDDPMGYSEKAVYDERLNRVETVFTEAYQDAMVSLKTAQNAIAHDEVIPDSQNAYMAENLMHGKNKNEMDLFNSMFRDPLIETINKIMNWTGMNWGDIDRYVYTKSGLERNREFFVRDWLERQRKTQPHSYEDLTPEEQDIFDRKAEIIETLFEDGDIETEEQKEKELKKALQEAHQEYVNQIEEEYLGEKVNRYQDMQDGYLNFAGYLNAIDSFIRKNIDENYVAAEHDYSGFRAMYGDEEGKYDEDAIIEELMNTEGAIDDIPDGEASGTVALLWGQIRDCTRYGLERYREAGMRSDEQIDRVEQMFHWYVPMRGFKNDTGEDMYQYFTGKYNAKSYVGGLLKHAKGRGSEASYPISTIFTMAYKAISDCNQNLVNQKLYRLCQAHPNDLVMISDGWAELDEKTGEFVESQPKIVEGMTEEEIRQETLRWEADMRQKSTEGKAVKLSGKATFDYKPIDPKKRDEHIVDVRINGKKKTMTVVGNPRMAQALNGQLRFENGKNVFWKWNAAIKNKMAALFTSYSPTFALRNMFRDWTHFRMILGAREGHGYASRANKYYRQSLFKMVGLFRKYRKGTLDERNEMERDFKDFMDNGGITGFVQMQKVDDIQKQMERLYKQQRAGKIIRLNNSLWGKILGAVETVNEAIENNARFATYRASRHYAGRTKARSAYDAKEVTVNFNRKGAGGKTYGFKSQSKKVEDAAKAFGVTSQVLGEGRIFFNATVQAIATTFKNFQNQDGTLNKRYVGRWLRLYAMPPFMFGLALPMINKMLAVAFDGDGDDDPYANLPEWTRRKNLCFYIGSGNFITIPIGQELAAFLSLGDIVAGSTYAPELKPVDKSWDDELIDVMNTFSPVDIATKITRGGLMEDPVDEVVGRTFSVLAPLVAVGQNLSWTGRPIFREDRFQNDQYTPEYQMVYSGTNPVLTEASKLLHELGGGDDITRGKLEVNPAIVQYLWEQYMGGPGKVFSNTISIGKDLKDVLTGDESEFNIRKVEGLKAFVQQGDDRTDFYRVNAKYRKYKEDAGKLYDAVRGYEQGSAENPEYVLKLEQISKGEDFVRMQIVREADKQLSKINKAANKADGAERKELRRLYNQQVKAVVDMLDGVGE